MQQRRCARPSAMRSDRTCPTIAGPLSRTTSGMLCAWTRRGWLAPPCYVPSPLCPVPCGRSLLPRHPGRVCYLVWCALCPGLQLMGRGPKGGLMGVGNRFPSLCGRWQNGRKATGADRSGWSGHPQRGRAYHTPFKRPACAPSLFLCPRALSPVPCPPDTEANVCWADPWGLAV